MSAHERRQLRYTGLNRETYAAHGDQVRKVIEQGVVIAISRSTRILIPWHRIIDLSWDIGDTWDTGDVTLNLVMKDIG